MSEPFYIFPILSSEQELPLFVRGIGKNLCERHMMRPKGSMFYQVFFCTQGEGRLIFGGKTYSVMPNTAFLIPKNMAHEYYATAATWDTHWLVLDGSGVEDIMKNLGFSDGTVFEVSDITELLTRFNKIHSALENDRFYGNYMASAYAYEYLLEFFRYSKRSEKRDDSQTSLNSSVSAAVDYIEQHYAQNIRLEDLCEQADVSKQHLCRLFRQNLQMRPMEYVTKVRIQHAKRLLLTTEKSVKDIGEQVGFTDNSYFAMLFNRHELMSPTEYRRQQGK